MKIKMIKVLSLQQVYPKFKEKQMPIKTTYKLSKLFDAINTESEFYTEQMKKIVDKYAEKDEAGAPVILEDNGGVQLKKEHAAEAHSESAELLNLEVDLPDIKFDIEELGDVSLTVEEFNYLLPFIKD